MNKFNREFVRIMSQHASCRICGEDSPLFFYESRSFFQCPVCCLVFTKDVPDESVAARHYRSQWTKTEPGFWKNQVDVLLACAKKYSDPARILDFGSGKGEIFTELRHRGYEAEGVDPVTNGFLKDQNFGSRFDLVIGVEVIEHLPDLWEELGEISKVLLPHGIMIFSTLLTNPFIEKIDAAQHFKNWWYKDDPTHLNPSL